MMRMMIRLTHRHFVLRILIYMHIHYIYLNIHADLLLPGIPSNDMHGMHDDNHMVLRATAVCSCFPEASAVLVLE